MRHPMSEFKENQKELAAKIKKNNKNNDSDIFGHSDRFRHNHIAYCELRGRKREQIEVPREGNEPSEYMIKNIKDQWLIYLKAWRAENEKTLCNSD